MVHPASVVMLENHFIKKLKVMDWELIMHQETLALNTSPHVGI